MSLIKAFVLTFACVICYDKPSDIGFDLIDETQATNLEANSYPSNIYDTINSDFEKNAQQNNEDDDPESFSNRYEKIQTTFSRSIDYPDKPSPKDEDRFWNQFYECIDTSGISKTTFCLQASEYKCEEFYGRNIYSSSQFDTCKSTCVGLMNEKSLFNTLCQNSPYKGLEGIGYDKQTSDSLHHTAWGDNKWYESKNLGRSVNFKNDENAFKSWQKWKQEDNGQLFPKQRYNVHFIRDKNWGSELKTFMNMDAFDDRLRIYSSNYKNKQIDKPKGVHKIYPKRARERAILKVDKDQIHFVKSHQKPFGKPDTQINQKSNSDIQQSTAQQQVPKEELKEISV